MDSYPSVGEPEGGMERERKKIGGPVIPLKPTTADIQRKVDTVTFAQHKNNHTFIRTFRRHGDPADDIHYIKWHGFICFVTIENV